MQQRLRPVKPRSRPLELLVTLQPPPTSTHSPKALKSATSSELLRAGPAPPSCPPAMILLGDASIEEAYRRAPAVLIDVLRRYPPAPIGKSRTAQLMANLDTLLRSSSAPPGL